ncbi:MULTISPECIES: hypothetical protein [Pseudonocardiaceae]|uniref:Site-specific recombinase XerD n=1 Tax=Amycolatopsis roodepoortensis TaxID=700274 RepID=A0ABR9LFL8_9PSEU|nr:MULTISPECIES: hypothetical protein [Pseudonocardiaceae]MBE1579498.1 hypothetical protein [Amycolatopsis roodepoortensis]TWE14952.1 hypothetical protein FHX69_7118 [Prauserella muralis]SDU63033.1 hypothetical protein SAMN04489733_7322 [Amycolatopsis keratiniphila]
MTPPPCQRCGATENYYSAGLCARCHRFSPLTIDSCEDCYAWGATRTRKWLCQGCHAWRQRRPLGDCVACGRRVALDPNWGACRLCWRQADLVGTDDLAAAICHGHQLFFADLFRSRAGRATRPGPPGLRPGPTARFAATGAPPRKVLQWTIFDAMRTNTTTTPRPCTRCGQRPVKTAQSDFCYPCQPGGPGIAPPCLKCGSTSDYYTAGLCVRCHRFSPLTVDSCPDCHAWGTRRGNAWLCEGCRGWRRHHPDRADCVICARMSHVNANGLCRLCRKQALWLPSSTHADQAEHIWRWGHQLYFADMFTGLGVRAARAAAADQRRRQRPWPLPARCPIRHQQLVAFTLPRDLHAGNARGFPAPSDPGLAAYLDECVTEHAARHGWDSKVATRTRTGLHILLGLQDTPGAATNASDVATLSVIDGPVRPILDVLAAHGFLHDDRVPTIERWFTAKTTGLPDEMVTDLRWWFDVMRHGHTSPPRSIPRAARTIQAKLRWALPALQTWAVRGHEHLREITRDDVLAILPTSGTPRHTMLQGLRSIFRLLKAHKRVFVNPTARIPLGRGPGRIPLPTPVDDIREALCSEDTTRAAIAALVAFHALSSQQLRNLQLTDVHDGHLQAGDRTIPLAGPVRQRLGAYLDYRSARWPATANPHLFIHYRSANHTRPVQIEWLAHRLGLSTQALREDRILHEVHATRGDIRRLCDLFGLSVGGAERYTVVLDPPDLPTSDRHA